MFTHVYTTAMIEAMMWILFVQPVANDNIEQIADRKYAEEECTWSHSGVSTSPGDTTLTRIGDKSRASARASPSVAAFWRSCQQVSQSIECGGQMCDNQPCVWTLFDYTKAEQFPTAVARYNNTCQRHQPMHCMHSLHTFLAQCLTEKQPQFHFGTLMQAQEIVKDSLLSWNCAARIC